MPLPFSAAIRRIVGPVTALFALPAVSAPVRPPTPPEKSEAPVVLA